MKIVSLIFLLTLPFLSPAQINGSVFYKYNDYAGSRPDAGATATIFPLKEPKTEKSTLVDLSGSFSFNNLDTGKYLLIIKSKETNKDFYTSFETLLMYNSEINRYFNMNIRGIAPDLQTQIEQKEKESLDYMLTGKTKPKKINDLDLEMMKLVGKFYELIPPGVSYKMGVLLPGENLYFKEINVTKEGADKIIVDFGTTYSR